MAVEMKDVWEVDFVGLEESLGKHRKVKREGQHPVSGLSSPVDGGVGDQGRKYDKEVVA